MLPEPRTASGKPLKLYSRSPKASALARIKFLPLLPAARSMLELLVHLGRGTRCRSWEFVETMVESLFRSNQAGEGTARNFDATYSVPHARRVLNQLYKVGLVRWTRVLPGGSFPRGETPDVDGGGRSAGNHGGNVYEVNLDALLGLGPVWTPAVRLVDERAADAPANDVQEDAETPTPDGERLRTCDQSRVITSDHSSDPPTPTALNLDPERTARSMRNADAGSSRDAHAPPKPSDGTPASSSTRETPAHAGNRRSAQPPQQPTRSPAPPDTTARSTRELEGKKEQLPGHDRPARPEETHRFAAAIYEQLGLQVLPRPRGST